VLVRLPGHASAKLVRASESVRSSEVPVTHVAPAVATTPLVEFGSEMAPPAASAAAGLVIMPSDPTKVSAGLRDTRSALLFGTSEVVHDTIAHPAPTAAQGAPPAAVVMPAPPMAPSPSAAATTTSTLAASAGEDAVLFHPSAVPSGRREALAAAAQAATTAPTSMSPPPPTSVPAPGPLPTAAPAVAVYYQRPPLLAAYPPAIDPTAYYAGPIPAAAVGPGPVPWSAGRARPGPSLLGPAYLASPPPAVAAGYYYAPPPYYAGPPAAPLPRPMRPPVIAPAHVRPVSTPAEADGAAADKTAPNANATAAPAADGDGITDVMQVPTYSSDPASQRQFEGLFMQYLHHYMAAPPPADGVYYAADPAPAGPEP
jgi:hypothetical protein